jgi:ech hydrogenase subunit A
MEVLVALICFPILAAVVMLMVRGPRLRMGMVIAAGALIAAASVSLVVTHFPLRSVETRIPGEYLNWVLLGLELALAALIFGIGIRHRRHLVSLLAFLQAGLAVLTEVLAGHAAEAEHPLLADKFSVIMALIVGVVGALIAVYSVGYMHRYHEHHREYKDRQRFFFFIQFIFLAAMFGILFSNSLLLMHFFWEVTTLCSFLLIGYNRSEQSRNNALLALTLNVLGGLAFSGAILYITLVMGISELNTFVGVSRLGWLVPAALLAFAGMTKSAQLPFSSWLLGAMVAPTPVSALLHSSTMVKAGVYLVLRLAPVLQGTIPGVMVALVGGVTFLVASLIAISQSDAKRVLAYSTIANLGLIVLCAGVGTYEAVWAGILLLMFHAVTKALLFLCVGTYEQKTNTRDIESMSGLIVSMPRLSIMIQIGIAGMFLAPFGMLVSKWAVLKALVDNNPLVAIFVVFGSSATLFFWVKWMGKLIEVPGPRENVEKGIGRGQWLPLLALSVLTVVLVGFYPVLSSLLIEPFVRDLYGKTAFISQGNLIIMSIMLGMVALFPATFFIYGRRVKVVDAYLAGANTESGTQFRGAAGKVKNMEMANYYLGRAFGEGRLLTIGVIACAALLLIMLGVSPL